MSNKGRANQQVDLSIADHNIPIAFSGEIMLTGWGENHRVGRTATFRLPEDEPEHPFRGMAVSAGKTVGQRFMAVLVMLNDDETPNDEVAEKLYGKHVRELHAKGWFFDRRVLQAMGTPDEFREWASRQSCVVCKSPAPSNVLRGPGYTAISVCNLHRHSDVAALATHQPKLIKAWVSHLICRIAGTDGLSEIPPAYFKVICEQKGILDTIPASYFDAGSTEGGDQG